MCVHRHAPARDPAIIAIPDSAQRKVVSGVLVSTPCPGCANRVAAVLLSMRVLAARGCSSFGVDYA